MRDPLVSVLIACFNAERWIAETLESVRRQTWRNIEIVVVDDGSTDASSRVVAQFGHPRLVRVGQPNRGQGAALNRALALATGEFVQFLDADDVLHPSKIERQVRRLIDDRDSVATAEWARFAGDPGSARFVPDGCWRDLASVDWLVTAWKDGEGMLFPALWLVPRDVAARAGPWSEDLTLNVDGEYFSRVVLAAQRVLFCEGARVYYRSGNAGSVSSLRTDAAWTSQRKSLSRCEATLLAAEDSERTRRVLALLWQRFAHASYPYHRGAANEALGRAKALHPVTIRPDGGPTFRLASRLAGWKTARVLQRWSGRR